MNVSHRLAPVLEIQASPVRDALGRVAGILLGTSLAVFVLDDRPFALKQGGLVGALIGTALGIALRVAYVRSRPHPYSLILTHEHLFGPPDRAGNRSRVPVHGLPITPLEARHFLPVFFRPLLRLTSPSGAAVAFAAHRFSSEQLRQLAAAIRALQAGAA